MTETEIKEALQRIEQLPLSTKRKTGTQYRRQMRFRKNDRLMEIVTRNYIPHAGYIDWDFDGRTLLYSGKYIKYPKNSSCQKWMKQETNRRIRNCEYAPKKGNFYCRFFDYWWTLYALRFPAVTNKAAGVLLLLFCSKNDSKSSS